MMSTLARRVLARTNPFEAPEEESPVEQQSGLPQERDIVHEQIEAHKKRFSVAPPGWENTVKQMKEHSEIDNPYALSWYMKNKGDKPNHPSKTALRVAARYQRAFEFPSPEALKKYLKIHPDADKTKHTVQKPGEEKPKEEHEHKPAEHGEHSEHEQKPKKSWKDVVKGLSEAAKNFVQKAPKAIQSFVHDEEFRSKALTEAHKAIKASPKKFVQNAMKHAKHEAHEFKEAGQGILAVAKGGKMSPAEKKAVKTVVTHVAIAAVATALSGGLALGAAALAKGTAAAFVSSLAKKIVLKSVVSELGVLPMLEEFGHAGHGALHVLEHITHLASKKVAEEKEMPPEDAFENYIAIAIAKGIKELDPETMQEALEEAAKG